MRDTAVEICEITDQLAGERSTLDSHRKEIAEVLLNRQDDFFEEERTPGEKRSQKKFDDTASLALEKFAAAMESILTPRGSKWHKLRSSDESINQNQEAAEWFDRLTDVLFSMRYSTKANYASQQHETYMSLGAFGDGVMILEDIKTGFRYKSSHVSEHYFQDDRHGRIDTDYRKYRLTARQAAEKFGEDVLPTDIKKALEKEPFKKFWFIHCVKPNPDYIRGAKGQRGMPFSSFHVAYEGKKLLGTGGFKTFPYIISRYMTSPNEVYGRSPGMTALAEIKMLNAMRKSDLRARHMAIDGPILASDESVVRGFKNKPHAINYGGLDANGNPLIRPYDNRPRIDLSNDAIEQSRAFINDTFLVTLFQILVETPAMTATEVLHRAQEKGALLAPTMGRQQSEALGPMIEREISILSDYGYFLDNGPLPMPDVIKKAGGEFEIEYTSPLSKMQKSEEALAVQRTLEAAIPMAQIDPNIFMKFDLNACIDVIGAANGAPAKIFRSPEEVAAMQEAQAQQQMMAQMAAAAPQVAGAVKDIAQAQSFNQ